jgi:DHA2 family lincomycin resistance protein-like MFS transporter
LGLLVFSTFVVLLNETIMGVALPSLMTDLDITAVTGQWVTTGFLLAMAIVIPAMGFLLQRFSLRSVFIVAMSTFSLGTLVAATAPGFGALLAGRVLQAGGTAAMLPLLMTTIMATVPATARGAMMGRIAIVIAVAPAIGPTISGVVLEAFDWRALFWTVLPISLGTLAIGALRIRDATSTHRARLDVWSILLSGWAFGGLVYGLSSLGVPAEQQVIAPWASLAIGTAGLVAFVLRQLTLQRSGSPLLDLRTFRSSNFVVSVAAVCATMVALLGTVITLPIYLQSVVGLSTLATGLALLPGGLAMGLLSPLVGRAFDRVGPRPLLTLGSVLVSASMGLFALLLDVSTSVTTVVAIHVVLNLALALTFTPLLATAMASVGAHLHSHASATFSTIQQLAGAAGAAAFVAVMATATSDGSDAGLAAGVRAAFTVGAVVGALGIVAALFIRRPALDDPAAPQPAVPVAV